MKKIWTLFLIASISLGSCVTVSEETPAPVAPVFVTSTLRPTRPALSLPTDIPPTSTPDPSTTTTPDSPDGTSTATTVCTDGAVLLEDVTVPDNALMTPGEKFTKTWRLMNTGKCNWSGYTIAFFAGDRMASPDSAPVPQTDAGKTVDVSVELTAPSVDGAYTGFYELRNAENETLLIGTESTFWVKILIGNATASNSSPVPTTSSGTPGSRPSGPASCSYTSSSSYLNEITTLINNA
ncbi:MAG TPA: NBR1-Ig-like domain-containing protein, partial [Anaerolineales bacterium]|nr:NBR1-Ig-like domain-containing protein [Anaerolineales bacterium]